MPRPKRRAIRDEVADAKGVAVHPVLLQFDPEAFAAESLQVPAGRLICAVRISCGDLGGELSFAATRQHDEAVAVAREVVPLDPGTSSGMIQMGPAEDPAQIGVTLGVLHEQGEVGSPFEGDLGAGDRLDAPGFGRLRKGHRAVKAVVVGEGDCL